MSWKKFFVGEPMPDKNDPKYRERYEREVATGRRFADAVGISWLCRQLQSYGKAHKVTFLVVTFGFVILCFVFNVFRLVRTFSSYTGRAVAVERVDSAMSHRFHEP